MSHDYFADPAWWSSEGTRGAWTPDARAPRRPRSLNDYPRRTTAFLDPPGEPAALRGTRIPVVATRPPPAAAPQESEPEPQREDPPQLDTARVESESPSAAASQPRLDEERDEASELARLRAAAIELEEAKLRVEREAERAQEQLRGQLVAELLPVLDNLDRSIDAVDHSSNADLHEGLGLVRDQFEGVLQGYGVQRIDAVGERFDPALHEAIGVLEVDSPSDDGRVVRQLQAGFRFGDRVLRAAKVQVGKLIGR